MYIIIKVTFNQNLLQIFCIKIYKIIINDYIFFNHSNNKLPVQTNTFEDILTQFLLHV